MYLYMCTCADRWKKRDGRTDGRALIDATKWMVRRGGGERRKYRANWEADGWTGWTGGWSAGTLADRSSELK